MISWLIAALQVAPIATTCPPSASFHTRPQTICVTRDALILTPQIRFTDNSKQRPLGSDLIIEAVANLIIAEQIQQVEIRIHDRTPDKYGDSKSARRARTLTRALVDLGVANDAIKARGYGEEQPLVRQSNPAAERVNTRVEFWLVGIDRLRVR